MRRVALSGCLLAVLTAAACRTDVPAADTPTPGPAIVLPAEWAGRINPLPDDAATIAIGRAAFLKNCAVCHGSEGDGKGVASIGLTPPPANFREGRRLSSKGDDVVFWRISTGIPDTAMPAFSGAISEDERWAILRFLRSLPGGRFEGGATAQPERT